MQSTDYKISIYDIENYSPEILEQKRNHIISVLVEREKSVLFNPDIHIDYPDLDVFICDPIVYIASLKDKFELNDVDVVILTTYSDLLYSKLTPGGYSFDRIDMKAAPDNTGVFYKRTDSQTPTIYIELVNEQDPKIATRFVLELEDKNGVYCGGLSGSVTEYDGERYVYISTMAICPDLPKGLGTLLMQSAIDFCRESGIKKINLGTQTAGHFYKKMGFYESYCVLKDLRIRIGQDGKDISEDLVMLEYLL